MKLTAFQYGKTELSMSAVFQGGNLNEKIPISLLFFLLETEGRKILVDVGCDTMPGFELFEFEKPVEVLEKYINRECITDVILTHGDHDHVDSIGYYPTARVYVNRDEASRIRGITDKTDLYPFDDEVEVCRGVVAKRIGGHSKGSSIVRVKNFVLCGDECYSRENLLLNKPTGASVCIENSLAFVEEYRKDCYIPILFHDADLVGYIGHKTLFEDLK